MTIDPGVDELAKALARCMSSLNEYTAAHDLPESPSATIRQEARESLQEAARVLRDAKLSPEARQSVEQTLAQMEDALEEAAPSPRSAVRGPR